MKILRSFMWGKNAKLGVLLYVCTMIFLWFNVMPIDQFITGEPSMRAMVESGRNIIEFHKTRLTDLVSTETLTLIQRNVNFTLKLSPPQTKFVAPPIQNEFFKSMCKNVVVGCSGLFTGLSSMMVRLQNVLMDKTFSKVQATGGNSIKNIMNQKEDAETYALRKGFFQIPCQSSQPTFKFDKHSAHLPDWLFALKFTSFDAFQREVNTSVSPFYIENKFTVALMRYEFANVYWAVMDMYNVYLTARFFNKTLSETNVLLIDERPKNHLDDLYRVIYNSKQLHSFPRQTIFKDLVWMYGRALGPTMKKQNSIPLVQEFRKDALGAFELTSTHLRNCSALNIRFIWRRNYVAHPRNPSGLVWRKIKNEDELLNVTKVTYPTANVQGIQLDTLTLKEQLEYISSTDLLVGMHGAAFGFSLFLPPGSGVFEMFPQYMGANWHMEYLVKWAGAHYKSWKNKDKKLEDTPNRYTTVPTKILTDMLKSLTAQMCP